MATREKFLNPSDNVGHWMKWSFIVLWAVILTVVVPPVGGALLVALLVFAAVRFIGGDVERWARRAAGFAIGLVPSLLWLGAGLVTVVFTTPLVWAGSEMAMEQREWGYGALGRGRQWLMARA